MKKLFYAFVLAILLIVNVAAQEDIFQGYEDEQLQVNAGTTPESAFYFLDKFFDKFGDELKVKEERIAEIKYLIEIGNIEAAREALNEYNQVANELEKEISPENRDEALRSAAAIRNAIAEMENLVPEEEKQNFVKDINEKERLIATAAEIADKIKSLCKELAGLDPERYYQTCRTEDNSPKWQIELDKELTDNQREEAKKFGEIMSQCFKTSGQNCNCAEIPFPDFARACSRAAPLATACDIERDEAACAKLDELEMPELPEHLQDILDKLESKVSEAQFDLHMPRECVEAGAKSPKDCGRIMINLNAPEECKEALLKADVTNEREGREICDKIMFELHAPKECVDKGITNPNECRKFMESFRGDMMMGPGPGPMGFDCRSIENPEERLACYDKSTSQMGPFDGMQNGGPAGNCMTEADWVAKKQECRNLYGEHAGDEPIMGNSGQGYECVIDAKCVDFGQFKDEDYYMKSEEIQQRERQCANDCSAKGGRWDFTGGICSCYEENKDYNFESKCDDCASKCESRTGQRLSRTDCVDNQCKCYYENIEQHYQEDNYEAPSHEPVEAIGSEPINEPVDSIPKETISEEPTQTESSPEPETTSEPASTDGMTGNAFLDYRL